MNIGGILTLIVVALAVIALQVSARYWRSLRLRRWWDRGKAAFEEKNLDRAIPAFRRCVKIAPEFGLARALLGLCLGMSGNAEEALEQIGLLEALHPRDPEILKIVAVSYATAVPDRPEHALAVLERLIDLEPRVSPRFFEESPFTPMRHLPRFAELMRRAVAAACSASDRNTP